MCFGRDLEVNPFRGKQVTFTQVQAPERATVRLSKRLANESERPVASDLRMGKDTNRHRNTNRSTYLGTFHTRNTNFQTTSETSKWNISSQNKCYIQIVILKKSVTQRCITFLDTRSAELAKNKTKFFSFQKLTYKPCNKIKTTTAKLSV